MGCSNFPYLRHFRKKIEGSSIYEKKKKLKKRVLLDTTIISSLLCFQINTYDFRGNWYYWKILGSGIEGSKLDIKNIIKIYRCLYLTQCSYFSPFAFSYLKSSNLTSIRLVHPNEHGIGKNSFLHCKMNVLTKRIWTAKLVRWSYWGFKYFSFCYVTIFQFIQSFLLECLLIIT